MITTKTCIKCQQAKFADDFYPHHKSCKACVQLSRFPTSDTVCKQCKIFKTRSEFSSKYLCKKCHSSNCLARYKPTPRVIKSSTATKSDQDNRRSNRNSWLKRQYGISLAEYEEMLRKQNGLCAICNLPERRVVNGTKFQLNVDHNHNTGKVRGLLCFVCNTALGKFGDSKVLLEKAINYLKQDD